MRDRREDQVRDNANIDLVAFYVASSKLSYKLHFGLKTGIADIA